MMNYKYLYYYNGDDTSDDRVLPYDVRFSSNSEKEAFVALLEADGFICKGESIKDGFPVLLINMDFKRYGQHTVAAKMSCKYDEIISFEKFWIEVYKTWREERTKI